MEIIGITGGIGSGKSEVMQFLEKEYRSVPVRSDELAHDLMRRGTDCYEQIVARFGQQIVGTDQELDRKKIAAIVVPDPGKREELDGIVHPAVRKAIRDMIGDARRSGTPFFFLESALLIEEHYDEICDEMWYVYADEAVRYQRLRESRGYPDEKIRTFMKIQLPEEVFRQKCAFVVDNSGDFRETEEQIRRYMKRFAG